MQSDGKVCPLSMASDKTKLCHPNCLLNVGGQCLFAEKLIPANK